MRILVIDDDALVGKSLARLLRAHDVEVMAGAANALEPICAGDYDAIFCDLMMPGVSGPELFAMVEARNPGVADRFIFVTGGAYTPELSEFIAGGQRRVLNKPFDRDTLQAMLDSIGPGLAQGR